MRLMITVKWKAILKPMRNSHIRSMVIIAAPIAGQNLVNFAVNLMDTVMLGQLGEASLTASSLANQLFFIVTLVVYGVGGGANVLIAQYWGKKDMASIHKILAYTYRVAMGFALLMCALALLVPEAVMKLFIEDDIVIQMGARYLRVISLSYLFFTGTTITTCVLRAVHTVHIAMKLSAVALCVNVGLNYILIFGKFGAPSLGITGAAIGTLCARMVEFLLLLIYLYRKEDKLQIRLKKLIPLDRGLGRLYASVSIPVIMNELFWALGEAVVAMVLGRMGREVVSANSIYAVVSSLSGVVVSGVNSAACVVVGNVIGAGQYDQIPELKRSFRLTAVIVGTLGAVVMLVCRTFMIDFYQVSEVTKLYARQIMLLGAGVEFFRSMQTMSMMGILRGAGDVKFAMMNDLLFLWLFTIPLGFMAGLVWHLPIPAVYLTLKLDQVIKVFTSEWRLKGDRWIKNLTTCHEN